MQWCGKDERCHRLQLPDLLISPMQHCTKVPLLLHNISRYTLDPSEQQMLTESLRTLETSLGTTKSLSLRSYLNNGRAIGMVVIRLSVRLSVCSFVTDVLWLSFRS